jgi:hypothetical protein
MVSFVSGVCFAIVKIVDRLEDKLAGLAESDRGLSKAVRKEEKKERVPCPNLSSYLRRLEIF